MVYVGGLDQKGRTSSIRSRNPGLCNVNSSECKINVFVLLPGLIGLGPDLENGRSQGSKNNAWEMGKGEKPSSGEVERTWKRVAPPKEWPTN